MADNAGERPDPDALLKDLDDAARQAVRGKLRVYFGSSAGVGKTYAMLVAARAQAAQGARVLAGIVETHGRREGGRMPAESGPGNQTTVRRLRPLRRRARMTLRPPLVAMRARNPCWRLRVRLEGWKVRFMAFRRKVRLDRPPWNPCSGPGGRAL